MTRGVKRFPHPRVYSQPGEVTGSHTHLKHPLTTTTRLRSLCVRMPGRRDNNQNPLWIIPRPSSSTSSQAQVDGGKACRSSWGWESVRVPSSVGKKKRKKRESKSTPELWHACWLMMGGVLPRTPGNLAVLVHSVRETEAWLQSERMVRIPRNPVATALKYESVSPSLLPSLPLSSVFYKLWSLPLPLIHALKQSNRSLDPSTVSSCFLLKCGNTLTFSTTIDVFPNKHWQHDTHIKPVGQFCCSWYSASGDEKTSSTTNLKHLWKM